VQSQRHRAPTHPRASCLRSQAPLPSLEQAPGLGNQATLGALGLACPDEELQQAEQISDCLGELDLYGVQSFLQGLAA
jgi:hypothetical protein